MYPRVDKKRNIKRKKYKIHNNIFSSLLKVNYFVLFLKIFHF